jgi:hypothetical protein
MAYAHAEKQARASRKKDIADYLTSTGRMNDAEPLAREWEKARNEALQAQERFKKANEDFVGLSGRTWSDSINKGIDAYYEEKKEHLYSTEMSHSPLFLSNVSEVMLCDARFECVAEERSSVC